MGTLRLSIGLTMSDRAVGLSDGSVRPRGIDLIPIFGSADEIFFRMLNHKEFDISEMSFAAYVMKVGRGESDLIAIPTFLSRSFRHGSAYVLDDSPLRTFERLAGLRIGTPEYQMTSNVWLRDAWQQEHGIDVNSIQWYVGGLDKPGRRDRIRLDAPTGLSITPIDADQTLSQMLFARELDLIISPDAPIGFEREEGIRRLLADARAAEVDYFVRSGIFPIMHIVVMKRSLYEESPWVARETFRALDEARSAAMARLRDPGFAAVSLAWITDAEREQRQILGEDAWSYGLRHNRKAVEAFIVACHSQGLTDRLVSVEELFVSSAVNEGDY